MKTDGIELPSVGVMGARFVDGMRECWAYDVNQDTLIARYDTVIDGTQRVVWARPFVSMGTGFGNGAKDTRGRTVNEWLDQERDVAKAVFEADERAVQKSSAEVRRLTTVRNG